MTCQVIFNLCKYDSATSYIISLHWIKVEYAVVFKFVVLMYKCVEGNCSWAPDRDGGPKQEYQSIMLQYSE